MTAVAPMSCFVMCVGFSPVVFFAVSIFWRAAITAGLAKADAPLNKVVGAIKAQFRLESLGVNAIDKKKGVNDFDKQYKELYKSLLAVMRP